MLSPMCWATSRLRCALVAAELDLGGEQVVLLGHAVGGELDVDDGADDAGDAADAAAAWVSLRASVTVAVMCRLLSAEGLKLASAASALAPPTISLISWVISAWRAWLASRV